MPTTNYLITGANRGIGKGLVEAYLSRENALVVATVRDPSSTSAASLASLPTGAGSKLIVIKLESTSETDAKAAIEHLKSQGVDHLDVVIANAGISNYFGPLVTTPISQLREHFEVNTFGLLVLFQATWPLLEAAVEPKFVTLSTGLATLNEMEKYPMPDTPYGASKAGVNWITKKIHLEHPSLIAFPIVPGWVQTEMGNAGALAAGMEKAPLTLEQSIKGLVTKIDSATRKETSGTLQSADGVEYAW